MNPRSQKYGASTASTLTLAAIVAFPISATADQLEAPSQVWEIARGGQLYDNWAKVAGKDLPKETHPAYPASGKKSGGDTWRCKECHGWDYKGVEGAYGKGSHKTGIKGLRAMVGADPQTIVKVISDGTHRYTNEMITPGDMKKLALLVSLGQIDNDLHIDRATLKSRGEAGRGAAYFQTICAVCHGFEGKNMNFGTPAAPEYVGTIARENPWEFMHKARFGQAGIPMISLSMLPDSTIADILAYAQTLPEK